MYLANTKHLSNSRGPDHDHVLIYLVYANQFVFHNIFYIALMIL
jgi:hypothetical protein